jgi:acetate kinase
MPSQTPSQTPAGTDVITVNAGSSSLKVALFEAGKRVRAVSVSTGDARAALDEAVAKLSLSGRPAAIGHRVVHGGPRNDRPRVVDDALLADLREVAELDPDHLPAEIAIIEACAARFPRVPQVACFDTAFHATIPRAARLLPIPREWEARGVVRYGFHGLSYAYLMGELARVAGEAAARGRAVLAHLGGGSSLAAVKDGRCADTTMGFTPTGGVPMGTRTGDLDPGVLVYMMRRGALSPSALDEVVNKRSGMLGLSGGTSDMRELLAREATDTHAADAVAVYCHAVKKAIGALAATIGGIETLVFSGGIGEHAAPVRARICEGLEHLGVRLDPTKNDASAPLVSTGACAVRVIPTDEESVILRETLAVLQRRLP